MKFKKKNIVLVGMTGVGKSTVGRLLSKEISYNFIDIDVEIEKATNLRIKDFFKTYGEQEFRKIEKSIFMTTFFKNKTSVISPGAGIFYDNEIRETIFNKSRCIFLKARIKYLISRLKKNISNRPMLKEGKLEETLKQMYIERLKYYAKSHITIDVEETSLSDILSKILKALKDYDRIY